MSDPRRSAFVPRTEFYMTVAIIWMVLGSLGSTLERSNDSLFIFVLSMLGYVLGIVYAVLTIHSASLSRRERAAAGTSSDQRRNG
jgi:hypothetical protein